MDKLKLAVIADDLTGAMDCSGYFGRLGFAAAVCLNAPFPSEFEVLAVTTNSRAEPADVARASVIEAVKRLGPNPIFKKIDSTLRGNIGVELSAILEASGSRKSVVAPAFPEMGRTTIDGVMLVNGVPVSETSFAADPVLPVRESNVVSLLKHSTGLRVAAVPLAEIEAGPDALHSRISSGSEEVWVCDVTRTEHLRTIVRAADLAEGQWLLCGSTGLAREMYLLLGKPGRKKTGPASSLSKGSALALVGSLNPVTAEQLLEAKKSIGLISLDFNAGAPGPRGVSLQEGSKILNEAGQFFRQGRSLAVTSTFSPRHPELMKVIPSFLAAIAARLLENHRISGLFLSGGDIAWEVCHRLDLSPISLLGEIEPGVPAGVVDRREGGGLRIVTKAGGFGTREVIVKALPFLERGELP